ncbi:MAG TPA: L-fuculokinase [Bacteroidales bacterium]|nr:L-fuculokinase [Bacteroidales bacterium]
MPANKKYIVVMDCGATNIRAVAIDDEGNIFKSMSYPNCTRPDPFYPEYRIWDIGEIWEKMCRASREVVAGLPEHDIIGVTVTTFGVDGTLFDSKGKILYPMISWQCERTGPVMDSIGRYIPVDELYAESATYPFSFNTINKIIWLSENRPELIGKAHRFLFAPSIFLYLLSGEMVNDITMAGTSMMTSAINRDFSDKILDAISFPKELFGRPVEPGSITGSLTRSAAKTTGLPAGTPVVATGHDTQFAIFGSGAGVNQPALSSGTWEILMVRSSSCKPGSGQMKNSITTEFDPIPGLYNIGNQWIASGVLELIKKTYFCDISENHYETMISEAENTTPGGSGLKIDPHLFDKGISDASVLITGLTGDITRGNIYRAMLEALSRRLAEGKEALEKAGGFNTDSIICVGGGSRNRLWNRLRANAAGVPLKVINRQETTVTGASFFVQSACGLVGSPEQAREKVKYRTEVIYPD